MTSSATAIAFFPGQFETNTPRAEAAATSMVSMPAPARITRPRPGPAPSVAAVTFVLLTMRMLGSDSATAAGRSSAVRSGRDTTVHPSSCSPSTPTFSNLSAIRTFIERRRLLSIEGVDEQATSELGLEPGALGRHDLPGIRYRHELVERRGKHRECDRRAARCYPPLELGRAPDTADEIDTLVGARVPHAQNRPEHEILQQAHIERADRVARVDASRIEPEPMPAPVEVDAHRAGLIRRRIRRGGDVRHVGQPREHLRRRLIPKVPHNPVIRKDPKLIRREQHGEKPVVLLIAVRSRVGGAPLFPGAPR